MSEFLFEVGVEEIPALDVYDIANQLKEIFESFLKENRINFGELKVFFTPRRFAVYIKGLSDFQETWETEVTGPPARVCFDDEGKPTKALLGFLGSRNLKLEDVYVEETKKGKYVKAKVEEGGKSVKDLLTQFLPEVLDKVKVRKSMRWDGGFRFLRPVRWILCLYGNEVMNIEIAGVKAWEKTYGNRVKGNLLLEVKVPSDYLEILRKNYVYADPEERRGIILGKIEKICSEKGLKWQEDQELLDEVINLVEYPGVIIGSFPERYLDLPEPVIITAMKQHQRYFAVRKADHRLANYFITAINNTEDYEPEIRPNHEKVLKARLEDAEFYMHEDLKVPLENRIEELKKVVFLEGVGTVYDKVIRVEKLCEFLISYFDGVDKELLFKAVKLCKVDLTTLMIKDGKEFTKLGGVIGMEYALRQGKDEKLSRIIYDHILPRFPGDELPHTLEGAIISLADKVDTLMAFLKAGAEISASQDPFGLRRTLYSIFELVKEKKLRFNFVSLLEKAAFELEVSQERLQEFLSWAWARLESYLEEKEGIRYDIVDCVVYANKGDIWDVIQRARVLNNYYLENKKEFEEVVIGQKRANNILSGVENLPPVDESLFEKDEEKNLHKVLRESEPLIKEALEEERYEEALKVLRNLKPYIDVFFDRVFVMVDDEKVRNNRLALLYELRECFRHYGDFSKIVVSTN
ncbi:MAG: glycine--tRNA ligase subunit beta [bacterium]|nr:glycine--tRNA ligase subunit beta [bacterium]